MAYITNTVKNVIGSSLYITDAMHEKFLYEGINNINVSGNLPAILDLTYYSQENNYRDVIYSEDDRNDIKIWFNGVELTDAGDVVESLTGTIRVLPNDGAKRFSIGHFVSKELELTIHDIDIEDIQDQVKISIGTLIENDYEYIPLGVFNIQDTPVNNNGKYIIKLRDNRVKFDFNYNAQPLIDNQYKITTDTTYQENKEYYSLASNTYTLLVVGTDYEVGDEITGTVYEKKGTATLRQIFEDICTQAGVEHKVYSFDGETKEVGIYDNTITATKYISYIAEQCGCTPTIDREGNLIFINWKELYVWRIPLSIVSDDYKLGEPFEIERVVYESGVIKYESSSDETLCTLYLDAANPYITEQSQVINIFNKLNGFRIDTIITQNMLGNPAIDAYDIIEVYDDEDANETVIFRTLANSNYIFDGKHTQSFDTQIGVEERTENVSKNSEATFKKWATTNIDNANAQLTLQAGQINDADGRLTQVELNISSDGITGKAIKQAQETANNAVSSFLTFKSDEFSVTQSLAQNLGTDVYGDESAGVAGIKQQTEENTNKLTTIDKYMVYKDGVLTLGESTSNFKLELEGGEDGEIRFMGNGIKLGYFNSQRLYVENTTVFNEQVIAKKGDEEATNYYWHVTDDGCLDLDYGGTEE